MVKAKANEIWATKASLPDSIPDSAQEEHQQEQTQERHQEEQIHLVKKLAAPLLELAHLDSNSLFNINLSSLIWKPLTSICKGMFDKKRKMKIYLSMSITL